MKIYWVIILTVLATVEIVGAEWNIPQGLTLVASPVSGPVSSVLQDQASRIDSMWHISKATPKWKFYSGSTQVLQSSTHPHIEALQANHGYVVQASSQALPIVTNPISIPAITPATGFQLTPLVPWDSAPIPVANIANTLAASGPLHAIFTLEAGQWLAYFHNPNLATQNIRNQLNSVGTLTEVTAGRAYFVSFSPQSVFALTASVSQHQALSSPQILVGNVPGKILSINNREAMIVPLSSTQPFTFSAWPDSIKFQLSGVNHATVLSSTIEVDVRSNSPYFANVKGPKFIIEAPANSLTVESIFPGADLYPASDSNYMIEFVAALSSANFSSLSNAGTDRSTSTSYQILIDIASFVQKGSTLKTDLLGLSQTISVDFGNTILQPLGESLGFSKFKITNFVVNP